MISLGDSSMCTRHNMFYMCQLDMVGWECLSHLYFYWLSINLSSQLLKGECWHLHLYSWFCMFPFSFVHFGLMYFGALSLGTYTFRISVSFWWIDLFFFIIRFPSMYLVLMLVLKFILFDHMIILFLVFWVTSPLFFIVAVPTYIPTNSIGGFPLLHTLSSICYL